MTPANPPAVIVKIGDPAPIVGMSSSIEERISPAAKPDPFAPRPQVRGRFIQQPAKCKGVPVGVLLGSGPGARRASMQGKQSAPVISWKQWLQDQADALERLREKHRKDEEYRAELTAAYEQQ